MMRIFDKERRQAIVWFGLLRLAEFVKKKKSWHTSDYRRKQTAFVVCRRKWTGRCWERQRKINKEEVFHRLGLALNEGKRNKEFR